MLDDIRPYDPQRWQQQFQRSDLYQRIAADFDEITFSSIWEGFGHGTPRQHWADRSLWRTKFSAVPFYYLEFLTQRNPSEIYDLGCGWNIFKRYIPNIVGVGAEDPNGPDFYADIHDFVDSDYVRGHQNYFESVFSICALHFFPLSEIRQRVIDFASMIRPGGRGWLALNALRMIELDRKFLQLEQHELESWIRGELDQLPFTVLSFDIDLGRLESGMDGNIRIVVER